MRNTSDRDKRGVELLCYDSFGKIQTSLKNHHIYDLPYAEDVTKILLPVSNAEKTGCPGRIQIFRTKAIHFFSSE
jgi:hypothetical protein